MGNVAIATAFVSYLGHFIDPLAGSTRDHVLQAVVPPRPSGVLTLVNLWGIRQAGAVQAATTVLKLVPLVAIASSASAGQERQLHAVQQLGRLGATARSAGPSAPTLWAFIGLESATVPAESVRDPERNVARATLIGTVVAAVVYILGSMAVMGILDGRAAGRVVRTVRRRCEPDLGRLGRRRRRHRRDHLDVRLPQRLDPPAGPDACSRPRGTGSSRRRSAGSNKNGVPCFAIVVSTVLLTFFMIPNYNSGTVDRFTDFILLATTTTLVRVRLSGRRPR